MTEAEDILRILEADFDSDDMAMLRGRMSGPKRRQQRGINPGCDMQDCRYRDGEIRKCPEVFGDGNMLLCRECFQCEMQHRQEHNDEPDDFPGLPKDFTDKAGEVMRGLTGKLGLWPIPRWEDLEVYGDD